MGRRILVSGSRRAETAIELAQKMTEFMRPGDTLVQGAAPGIDTWAAQMWAPFGPVESYPARDFPTPLLRNLHMISLDIDECHVFAMSWRSGSAHCARHARKAGIPTFDHGVDTRIEARG